MRGQTNIKFCDTPVTLNVTCPVTGCCLAQSLTTPNASSVSQNVVSILEAPTVYHLIHNSPPLVSVLSQIHSTSFHPNSFMIHFSITLPSTFRFSKCIFLFSNRATCTVRLILLDMIALIIGIWCWIMLSRLNVNWKTESKIMSCRRLLFHSRLLGERS
jgi:hypothetical protein